MQATKLPAWLSQKSVQEHDIMTFWEKLTVTTSFSVKPPFKIPLGKILMEEI
jgi:hypothetical protein